MNRAQHIKEIINRGVEQVYPSKSALEKVLKSNKKLRLYHGIDPTAKSLHLGHLIQLLKLKQFQDLGHRVVILIGDFTGMIGDPTDRQAARQPLTRKQVLANAKNYKTQIGRVLNLQKTEFRFNSEWWDKMSMLSLIEWAAKLSASQLWQRDMFQERLKQSREVHLHELLYPLFQGYDSVALDVDLETGGSDQIFNMLVGRTLMKSVEKEMFVLATKLLTDPTGTKMGKTKGNAVNLADHPKEMYGKIMSWPDGLIVPGFELCTLVGLPQVYQIKDDLKAGKNPKVLKMLLAYKIVELNYGKAAAIVAEENFKKVFEKKEIPEDVKRVKVSNRQLVAVLVATKLASSKSEARRLIKQGGVKVDGKVVKDERAKVKSGAVVQKGKRHFVKIG